MIALIGGLKGTLSVLLVEHDMDAVFRLADRISVLVNGRVIASGSAGGDPRERGSEARLPGRGGDRVSEPLLRVENLETAYGASQVLFGVVARDPRRRGRDAARAQRHGQDDDRALDPRPDAGARRRRSAFRGERIERLPTDRIARMGIALVPEGRQIFPNLTVREHLVAFAANRSGAPSRGRWSACTAVSAARRAARQHGQPALRRRAADARDRPRADDQPAPARSSTKRPRGSRRSCARRSGVASPALKAPGQTILVIDKYVERLVRIADRHTIIERGRVAWQGSSAALDADRGLWHRYLGV